MNRKFLDAAPHGDSRTIVQHGWEVQNDLIPTYVNFKLSRYPSFDDDPVLLCVDLWGGCEHKVAWRRYRRSRVAQASKADM